MLTEGGKDVAAVSVADTKRAASRSPLAAPWRMLERLIPNALGALLQANIHQIRPGANTDGAIEHEGKEFGYVLEGILRLVVNDVVYTIRRGDSFSFASRIPHKYSNPGKTSTRVLLVNTPPTF